MAKLFASEVAMAIALDAPLMIVGEGTNEIQRDVIVRQLVRRGGLAP
jgi:alkylation response protein AidB-like acyl-CoA dehydrogenase